MQSYNLFPRKTLHCWYGGVRLQYRETEIRREEKKAAAGRAGDRKEARDGVCVRATVMQGV